MNSKSCLLLGEVNRGLTAEFPELPGAYAWASFSKGSVALAKDLTARGPADATLIGVCLDHRDLAPARAKAAAENLPGEQIYDWPRDPAALSNL